jgi:peptidyl-prolyl cis-trans isomerase B (cyclophilin B)
VGNDKRERHKAGHQIRRAEQAAATRRQRRTRTGRIAGIGGVVAAVVLVLALVAGGCGNGSKSTTDKSSPATATTAAPSGAFTYGDNACPAPDDSSPRKVDFGNSPPKNCLDPGKTYTATFTTSAGTVTVDLDTTKTPGTANNFVFLSRWHYYDNTKIFRASPSIDILQGGSPHTQTNADPGPGYEIPDEPKFTTGAQGLHGPYTYQPGDLVMARTSAPDSASAQFFFVTGPNGSQLNSQGTYVVFGHVTSGLDILQKILGTSTPSTDPNALPGDAVPNPPVTIEKVAITEK